jgi:tetratricopeptide (TPR) repeat protein
MQESEAPGKVVQAVDGPAGCENRVIICVRYVITRRRTLMADESPLDPLVTLISKLRDLHVHCGGPSTSELNRVLKTHMRQGRSGPALLVDSTVWRMLNGTGKSAPKIVLMSTFVMACDWYAYIRNLPDYWTGKPRIHAPIDEDLMPWLHMRREADAWVRARRRARTHTPGIAPASSRIVRPAQVPVPAEPAAGTQNVLDHVSPPHTEDLEDNTSNGRAKAASIAESAGPLSAPIPGPHGPVGLIGSPEPSSDTLHSPVTSHRLPSVDELLQRIQRDRQRLRAASAELDTETDPLNIGEHNGQDEAGSDEVEPELSFAEQRMFRSFGQHGVELHGRAWKGDLDAAHRLGVLLHTERRHQEGDFYLDKAIEDRNGDAKALRAAEDRYSTAIAQAHLLGLEAAADGDREAAITYSTAAARGEHKDAALHLATLLLSLDRRDDADRWYRIAANADPTRYPKTRPSPHGTRARRFQQESARTQPINMEPSSLAPTSTGSPAG